MLALILFNEQCTSELQAITFRLLLNAFCSDFHHFCIVRSIKNNKVQSSFFRCDHLMEIWNFTVCVYYVVIELERFSSRNRSNDWGRKRALEKERQEERKTREEAHKMKWQIFSSAISVREYSFHGWIT